MSSRSDPGSLHVHRDRRQSPAAPSDDTAQFRDTVLQKVRELSADNDRLLQSVSLSEKRFSGIVEAVWRVQEQERRRLARDLHDGIGQTLTALTNQLQRILDDARAMGNLGLEARLADALEMTAGALHDTREMSRLLRPPLLDDLGLAAALGWLARTLGERAGVLIEFHTNIGEQRLAPDIETLVFRITQEALTNVIRHSGAPEAHVLLTLTGGLLRLRIRDHGRGFDNCARTNPGNGASSTGLRGMRDRAELFGGLLDIQSAPSEGATVQMTLPLGTAEHTSTSKGKH
ncbi:MAG: sensor histidine kinase [Stenotrophobium sp.]